MRDWSTWWSLGSNRKLWVDYDGRRSVAMQLRHNGEIEREVTYYLSEGELAKFNEHHRFPSVKARAIMSYVAKRHNYLSDVQQED